MDYQALVKDLFNDMFSFFNGRQTMDLKALAESYPDEPLLLAFIGGLDQALCVPYNEVMKQCYAFYKQYCGRALSEEEWKKIVEGVQIFNQKWQNTWCRGLILAILSILEKEDNDWKGVQPSENQNGDNDLGEEQQELNTAA
ncbi:MAG: hypothetical protein LBT06_10470 [Hungatella sp.]|jgi:hypothetical protein|nr:hypothetical protein [Hungatella sp.]